MIHCEKHGDTIYDPCLWCERDRLAIENAALREKLAKAEKDTWAAVQLLACCQILAEGHEPDMVTSSSPACEAVRLLRDKLAAAEAAMQWRPMESAPKTGVALVFDPNHGVRHGFYRKAAHEWVEDCADNWGVTLHPTRWMPLPPAPGGER